MDASMDAAHRQDYADLREIRMLRERIEAFLVVPPARCSPLTQVALDKVVSLLAADQAHVIRCWD